MDSTGNAVYAWQEGERIKARARSAAGALSSIQTVSSAGRHPQLAISAAGTLLAWAALDSSGKESGVEARTRTAAGTLGPTETISPPGQQVTGGPRVGVDAEGNAVLSWLHLIGGDAVVAARTRSADGALGPLETVFEQGHPLQARHELAVDANGNAVFLSEAMGGPGLVDLPRFVDTG